MSLSALLVRVLLLLRSEALAHVFWMEVILSAVLASFALETVHQVIVGQLFGEVYRQGGGSRIPQLLLLIIIHTQLIILADFVAQNLWQLLAVSDFPVIAILIARFLLDSVPALLFPVRLVRFDDVQILFLVFQGLISILNLNLVDRQVQ